MAGGNKNDVLDQGTMAGAALGGIAGVGMGGGTGLGLGAHVGLCALGGLASCGLVLPVVGAVVGALAAKRWLEGRLAGPANRRTGRSCKDS